MNLSNMLTFLFPLSKQFLILNIFYMFFLFYTKVPPKFIFFFYCYIFCNLLIFYVYFVFKMYCKKASEKQALLLVSSFFLVPLLLYFS